MIPSGARNSNRRVFCLLVKGLSLYRVEFTRLLVYNWTTYEEKIS